jgi:hypothetical protein
MKYMLLVYLDENALSRGERERCYRDSAGLARELHSSGHYLGASPLEPTCLATSVRLREGKRLVTDGPFAETREQLGGYYILETDSIDEALEAAKECPGALFGTVELRPIMDMPEGPS